MPDTKEGALAIKVSDPALQWGPCPPIFPGNCQIAVLHGDPAVANADVFQKVAGKCEIPPHFHSSAERMVLVTGELSVTFGGQAPSTLRPGTDAYTPATNALQSHLPER